MKKKFISILCMLIFQFSLVSCISSNSEPQVNLSKENTNKQIKVFAPNQFNTFKNADLVVLQVEYHSNNTVTFPNNYNIRIFQQSNGKWKELKEIPITRLPETNVVFSEKTEQIRSFTFYPDLTDYSNNNLLRIYLIGDMENNSDTEKVGAYVDIELHP